MLQYFGVHWYGEMEQKKINNKEFVKRFDLA